MNEQFGNHYSFTLDTFIENYNKTEGPIILQDSIFFVGYNLSLSLIPGQKHIVKTTPFFFQLKIQKTNGYYGSKELNALIRLNMTSGKTRVIHIFGDISPRNATIQSRDGISINDLALNNKNDSIICDLDLSTPTYLSGHTLLLNTPSPSILKAFVDQTFSNDETKATFSDIQWLITRTKFILNQEPSYLHLNGPIHVVGSLDANYDRLLTIFKQYGKPSQTRYLFLGNYVNKGRGGSDIIILLCAFKVLYPNNIYFLRGKHELRSICQSDQYPLNFDSECKEKKLDYELFISLFDCMPIAALIGNSIFCVHSGISPMASPEDIENFERPSSLESTFIKDFLLSVPNNDVEGYTVAIDIKQIFKFGKEAVQVFLTTNNYKLIVRTHENLDEPYTFPLNQNKNLISLFSSPKPGNKGSVMIIDENLNYSLSLFEAGKNEVIENPKNPEDLKSSDISLVKSDD